jgi:hypothetical protein
MTSKVSFCASDGDAEGFCYPTCRSTPLKSTGLPMASRASPIPIFSRAVDLPVNGLCSVGRSSEGRHAQTPTISEAWLKIVTAPTLCLGSSQHANRHPGGRRFCTGTAS